ncbi:MAG TPA: SRPBCC family protein [Chitinophagaceae bacterium]|jgi:ligand-binding SRPBCC domain-containing protein|nr:SRPBCC family protein [Chitinophagaceae bacterium]
MPLIHLTTFIEAPVERVFDLSRNIELHKESMKQHKEEAVAGTRFGLINKDETVTWKAKHFFKTRILRIKIIEMQKPMRFVDEQAQGSFKEMKHEHFFKPCENGTIMIDLFHYEIPYGSIGKLLNSFYLTRYLKNLLQQRNQVIKEYAETNKWRRLLEK